ncbi:transglutaminaseTgpA domain-containing protein [Nonomuraea sp. NPDC050202]|uniref:transglutaminaseTgpA domain-containing protein n=1 Tax=Nonomuraea sp. NPDC050202 TaxID=3155035 RepID=UPI0033E1FAAA
MRLTIASGVAAFTAALLLSPLFQGGGWFWTSLGAVLAVVAAGLLSSRLSLPAWAAPLVGVAATWIYLTAAFASEEAWALVVPTKGSVVELARLLGVGWADIQRFAAPVPETEGITLLTAGGVALIAIAVDLLAARVRRAALSGLPLLALATVPATILTEPVSWWAFIVAALGFVSLLIADGRERVGHWGRAVLVRRTRQATSGAPAGGGAPADTSGLRLSGKRIGFAAILLAVLLPAALPAMEPVSFFTFGVGGRGSGPGNSISIPNPIANLKGQLDLPQRRVVLSYTSSDNKPRYLRIYALDTFDGQQFGMTQPKGAPENRTENGPLPEPPGLGPEVKINNVVTNVQISDEIARLQFLPLPYPAREIRVDGDWRADVDTLMVFSTREEAAGIDYDVMTSEPEPTADLLDSFDGIRPEVDERFLALPDGLPPEIRKLAEDETAGARTSYDAALKLQEFFTRPGNFQYDLRTQGHNSSALRNFLISDRVGYCEQFAASMAVLARMVGIPSRVAIGYTGGVQVGDRWEVGTNDSHSWPELYFEGVGWLPFEPTPSGAAGQGSAMVPAYAEPRPTPTPGTSSTPTPGATSSSADEPQSPTARRNIRELDREGTVATGALPPDDSMPLIGKIGIGAAALVLVLLIPAGLRLITRNRRVRSLGWKVSQPSDELTARMVSGRDQVTVAAAWAELDDVLYDYGMARETSETPRALARRLTQQYEFDAGSAAAITAIASAVERVLFARDPGRIEPMSKDLRKVRQALAATVSRGRRVRAVLLPPSTLRRLRLLGERLLDGFDLLETIRLRRTATQKGG